MSTANMLSGSVALVTGASSGLGRHFATVLARAGAAVAVTARRTELLQELASTIESVGGKALAVNMDVTRNESVGAAFDNIQSELGVPNIVVNNSGVVVTKPLLDQNEADWDSVLDTNLKGAFLVATEAARRLRRAEHAGSIVNISSIVGLRNAGGLAPYAASKAGLAHLTRNMALELARYQIRVNAIAPGYFDTDLNHDYWSTPQGAEMIRRIPQRRLGRLEDLDGVLLLLCSDASRYITGAVLPVDGGHLVSTL